MSGLEMLASVKEEFSQWGIVTRPINSRLHYKGYRTTPQI